MCCSIYFEENMKSYRPNKNPITSMKKKKLLTYSIKQNYLQPEMILVLLSLSLFDDLLHYF